MQEHYQVAVLGLGAMGAATLYQLSKAGANVIGVDRHAPPHTQGSSHGDTRITRLSNGEGPQYLPLVRSSHRIWRELEALSGEALFEQCGVLVMTSSSVYDPHDPADFTHRTIELAKTYGIEHQVLDAAQIRQRFGQFSPVLDSAIGYFEPQGGYLRPERCIAVQLQLAAQQGAQLRLNETVLALENEGTTVRISTDQGVIYADKVIVSAGMWSAGLLGAPFDALLRVCRQTLYWFEVSEPARFAAQSPSFILTHGPAFNDVSYGFPPLPGEGSMKIATEQYETACDPYCLDRNVSDQQIEQMYRTQVAGRFSGVGSRALKTSVCAYTVTPDYHFIIDEHPCLPNVTVVSACSGHGFKHSAGLGEALAQRCMSGRSETDLSAFSLQRFKR
ncbi:N-methyl-L-tryptophan oxidase [Pseudomonas sp. LJDD11]|uniref:N-methyl-L-tryptophan oxidase n=1 Tax=Pseudomonas sp. LJDD11 TaxID=2931984 RepID=UPI00211C4EA3|nr:N-methyl-L-tryptophan oxidase [Pseudomonas sp. LJDD11]MCQ9422089.1 N-methyl-L-tryptophan oxidase [Pseudomonas sp. LJDD11]